MSRAAALPGRFDPASLAALDEPVQRYFSHAIPAGARLSLGVRLTMVGRIKVGAWLSFTAEQEFAGHAFTWRARAGWGPFKPLHVVDRYRDGAGSMDGRLLNRLSFLHADDQNTARAAAGRAAVESIWVPASLLPERGATWRAEGANHIVASFDVPPERPEVHVDIGDEGAVRSVKVMRWGNVGREDFGYIPFGATISAERRFGDVVLPSRVTVGGGSTRRAGRRSSRPRSSTLRPWGDPVTKREPPEDRSMPPARGHSRRSFLRRAGLAGGTAVVVSAGGLSYRAYGQGVFEAGEGGAYDAWRDWEHGRGPLALVSAAILAANPHNSQAWVFRTTPSRVDMFADRKRSTEALDPFDREMYVGLGCALENLLQAAPAHGYRAELTLLPTPGQPVHVARIDLQSGPRRRGALYEAIPERRTDRSAYEARALARGLLPQMTVLAGGLPGARLHWFTSDADRARIGTLMVAAARAITRDDQQSRNGFRLFRSSWDDIQKHKDGLTLDAQGLSALTTAVAKLLPASDRRSGDEFWVDQTRTTHTRTAAAYGVVAVPDAGDDADRLMGGRLLERIHLWTTANGIALHHMNQITERADRERQLRLPPRFGGAVQALIPEGGGQPLVAFRVGYATGDDGRRKSPRRPAEEVIA